MRIQQADGGWLCVRDQHLDSKGNGINVCSGTCLWGFSGVQREIHLVILCSPFLLRGESRDRTNVET